MHFRKPTQTTRATPFNSFHPHLQKIASIKQEVKRVIVHTSDKQLLSNEFRYIIYKFLRNGYPFHLIARYANYQWALSAPQRRAPPPSKIFLPHFPSTSRIISNAARQADFQLIELPHKSLSASMLPTRPPRLSTPLEQQSNLIYGIPCLECDRIYIGQTKQTLKARINHHKSEFKHSCPNNSLVHHYTQSGHLPNFASLFKFYSQPNFRSRLNLEAICITSSANPVSNHILPQLQYLQSWTDLLSELDICIQPIRTLTNT